MSEQNKDSDINPKPEPSRYAKVAACLVGQQYYRIVKFSDIPSLFAGGSDVHV